MEKQSTETRELITEELDSVSGGYIWLPSAQILIAYLTGAGIRAGERVSACVGVTPVGPMLLM